MSNVMSSPSKYNYSTVASTLRAVREENVHFQQIIVEQKTEKALKAFGVEKPTEALTKALQQRFLEKPKKELGEREFTALKRAVEKEVVVLTPIVTTTPMLLPQVSFSRTIDIPRCWSSKRMTELMNWRNP